MAEGPEGGHLLTVDEGTRPRANSDPSLATSTGRCAHHHHHLMLMLPEIRVEDCTDAATHPHHPASTLPFGADDPSLPRRRSNTCPEDLFRKRNGRPPTPPPGTFRKGHRFRSGFSKPAPKESVSFAHHRLSKLAESEDSEDPHPPSEEQPGDSERLSSGLSQVDLEERDPPGDAERGQSGRHQPSSSGRPCSSRDCGDLREGGGESGAKTGSVCGGDLAEDSSFQAQSSSVKCRCSHSKTTAMDKKQLQAC